MQLKHLTLALPIALVSAQAPALTALLSATPSLANLTTFVGLYPDLVAQLSAANNITILAPSNAAFSQLLGSPAGAGLANNSALIKAVLSYHVLQGVYPASAVKDSPAFIPTLLDNAAYSNVTGGQRVEAVKKGDSVVFYSGLLQNSTVTTADVAFTGGVVHVIDTVLTLPEHISTTASAAGLTSLVGAVTKANLVETLDTTKDLTVFAPNNAAFAAIGSALPNLTVAQLTDILGYHVVPGTVGYSSLLSNGQKLKTLQGGDVTITINNGSVFVNSAKVVTANVLVANGVVHVIDNVLNPANPSATANPTAATQTPAYSGASAVPTASASGSAAKAAPSSGVAAAGMIVETGVLAAALGFVALLV